MRVRQYYDICIKITYVQMSTYWRCMDETFFWPSAWFKNLETIAVRDWNVNISDNIKSIHQRMCQLIKGIFIRCLQCSSCSPCIMSYLLCTTALSGRYYYFPNFSKEETEAQEFSRLLKATQLENGPRRKQTQVFLSEDTVLLTLLQKWLYHRLR